MILHIFVHFFFGVHHHHHVRWHSIEEPEDWKPGKTNIPIINRRAVLLVNSHCLLLIKVFPEYFLNLSSLWFYLFTCHFPIEIQLFL